MKQFEMNEEAICVSIIIPVYNVAEYLRECLDSVISQTYSNLDIICVNDGSTDESGTILEEYAAKDLRITIVNQENAGLSGARNSGLEKAKGDWVLFLDSDDWIEKSTLAELLELTKKSNTELICFGYRRVDEKGNFLSDKLPIEHTETSGEFKMTPELIWALSNRNYVHFKFIKKRLLDDYGLRFYPGVWFEDFTFSQSIFALMLDKNICVTDSIFYNYRQREGSIMKQMVKSPKVFDSFTVLRELFEFYRGNGFSYKLHELAPWLVSKMYYRTMKNAPADMIPRIYEDIRSIVDEFGLYKGFYNKIRLWGMLQPRPKWSKLFYKSHQYTVKVCFLGLTLFSSKFYNGEFIAKFLGMTIAKRINKRLADI